MFAGVLCFIFDRVGCVLYFFACFDFMHYLIGMTVVNDLRNNSGHQSIER
jgi:hypothetical protein